MATKFIEPGSASTQDFNLWTASLNNGGTISSSSQAVLGSVRSIAAAVTGTLQGPYVYQIGILADAGRRASFGFRFTGTLNDSIGADLIDITNSSGNPLFDLCLTSAGKINLINGDTGATYTLGSAVLVANTDYRISIVYTITSTTVNTITVRVYDSSDRLLDTISATNVTLPRTGSDRLVLTQGVANGVNTNVTFYFAHIYVDDGTSGDPGNIRVTAKRPNANGTANELTTQIGSGGSGYGSGHSPQVNERPASDSNGWSIVIVAAAKIEEYNSESVSQGDVDISYGKIIDFAGWVRAKALASETGKIIVDNTQTDISLTSTITVFTKIAGSTVYPAGTGTDIGIVTSTTATTVSLYECGIIVAYISKLPAKIKQVNQAVKRAAYY